MNVIRLSFLGISQYWFRYLTISQYWFMASSSISYASLLCHPYRHCFECVSLCVNVILFGKIKYLTWLEVLPCCRHAQNHYLHWCWPRFMSPYGCTGPQWVNISFVLVLQQLNHQNAPADPMSSVCTGPIEQIIRVTFNSGIAKEPRFILKTCGLLT